MLLLTIVDYESNNVAYQEFPEVHVHRLRPVSLQIQSQLAKYAKDAHLDKVHYKCFIIEHSIPKANKSVILFLFAGAIWQFIHCICCDFIKACIKTSNISVSLPLSVAVFTNKNLESYIVCYSNLDHLEDYIMHFNFLM